MLGHVTASHQHNGMAVARGLYVTVPTFDPSYAYAIPIMSPDAPRTLSILIDRIEAVREEVLSIQRSLERIEGKIPAESQSKTKKKAAPSHR